MVYPSRSTYPVTILSLHPGVGNEDHPNRDGTENRDVPLFGERKSQDLNVPGA